ncbi:hypothetical protein ACIRD3_10760 [Kitasatospora sp. NPDC093550]|uniref:hypothetical protein n=1 Tax=Kitasatospora sp. NPDC093550 TaxID=3364089 RepID=UPI0038029E6A
MKRAVKRAQEQEAGTPSLPRHLARGAAGFGALAASVALLPVLGAGALLLAPAGLYALRGCPLCWTAALLRVLTRGRTGTSCPTGRCPLPASRTGGRDG